MKEVETVGEGNSERMNQLVGRVGEEVIPDQEGFQGECMGWDVLGSGEKLCLFVLFCFGKHSFP